MPTRPKPPRPSSTLLANLRATGDFAPPVMGCCPDSRTSCSSCPDGRGQRVRNHAPVKWQEMQHRRRRSQNWARCLVDTQPSRRHVALPSRIHRKRSLHNNTRSIHRGLSTQIIRCLYLRRIGCIRQLTFLEFVSFVAQGSGAITAGTQLNRDLGNATIWIDCPAIDEDAIPLDLDLAYLHPRWCVGRDRATATGMPMTVVRRPSLSIAVTTGT